MVTEPQHPVFVYGTLLPGQPNRRVLDNSIQTVTKAVLNDSQMYGAGHAFPYVVDGDDMVVGELIWLAPIRYHQILARLDQLEGYGQEGSSRNHYDRVERSVTTDQGTITAWVYLASGRVALGLPIKGGDWLASQAHDAGVRANRGRSSAMSRHRNW